MTTAQELHQKSINALEVNTQEHVKKIVGECEAMTVFGRLEHRASTDKMLSVIGVIKTLESLGFRVDKVESKDQRGEVEGYYLVLHW